MKLNTQSGFGLAEVLVSMVILAMVSSGVFLMLRNQNKASVAGSDITMSTHLGKQTLDSLRVSSFRYISSGNDTINSRYIRDWKISTGFGRKSINVTVYWPLTGDHYIAMNTMLSDDQFKVE